MKKIIISLLVMISACISAFGVINISQVMKQENMDAVETIAKLDSVEAAVANTREVQTRLKKWGYYNGAVDGVYGAKTRQAVIAFQ